MGIESAMHFRGKEPSLANFDFCPVLCSMYSKLFMHLDGCQLAFRKLLKSTLGSRNLFQVKSSCSCQNKG